MDFLDVAIVGGGASGTLVAVHWLRKLSAPGRGVILDEHQRFARGIAYSSERPQHLLNVPVAKMSAFPDQPDHFWQWVQQKRPTVEPSSFVPRFLFGQYLGQLLQQAQTRAPSGTQLQTVGARVTRIERDGPGYRLHLASGASLVARQVVLAMGQLPPLDPPGLAPWVGDARYHRYPWSTDWVREVRPNDAVLLIGAGLTMVDAVLSLQHAGHRGKIWVVSRHGLLPRVHSPSPAPTTSVPSIFGRTLRSVGAPGETLRSVVRRVRAAIRKDPEGWRTVVDSLRAVTPQLWMGFSTVEKQRFVRHLRSYWEIHRHRTPPEAAAVLGKLAQSGQLQVVAARIHALEAVPEGIRVALRLRGSGSQRAIAARTLSVQHLVNCTGPASDIRKHGGPLVESLVAEGLAHADVLGMGLEPEAPSLFVVGPLRRGALWESTAIPEIRVQAAQLAEVLASTVERRRRTLRAKLESSRGQVGRGLAVAVPVLAAAAYFLVPWYRALPFRFRLG